MQDYLTYKQIYFKRHHVIKLRTTRNVTKKVIKKKWLSKKNGLPFSIYITLFLLPHQSSANFPQNCTCLFELRII